MTLSEKGLDLIKQAEALELDAYLDSVGIPTIGWGSTRYKDGSRVKMGDTVTPAEADSILAFYSDIFAEEVDKLVTSQVSQNQFDALVSLAYNIGISAFKSSTVLRRVNENPSNQNIRQAFLMWNKGTVNGKKVAIKGLTNRRMREANYYFS